ncbi:SusC/RagA family TonB-linked outer membrane protein [Butyricimonas virosa]|nr:SusC/RagA family TonB-linked outer membrane protein [Butyricimonas virosa]MBR5461382.1 SusC/RagA family TonB-linked outer membrane protein [Butyricimonas sp.]MBS5626480.1 SusC/RagA family TonB-linked outer membrane protein [Porphyromonadaceae bacterium]
MTRFLFIFVFVASLHVSAALHSQNKMVTLHLKGVSLEEVIQSLKLQTDYGFFYNIDSKDIKKMTNISVDVKNMALEDVLLQILKGTNLTYSIVNDVVILNTRNSIVVNDSVRKNHVLVGRVMDMNKEPLPGVTVRLENTSMGTATNFEGVFSFRLPVEKGKLILSFVGFKTKGVEFKLPSDTLKIVLEEEVENVEEVVVTGYFNKAKESFTGSEVTIETEELKKVGALSITQALSAFDPSIRLAESLTNGSNPNVLPDITIRGENGFDLRANADDATTNPNAPLYILDGVEVSAERVYDMDVNRVESITILKDASATALYGSRASNGVIVITTIRPKSGQIRVSLNANYNISVPDLRDYNLMNAEEKLEYERLAGLYQDTDYLEQCKLDELYNSRLEEVRKGVNTYWLSQPLTTSLNQRYSINFEGGDEYFRYGIDLRYDTDKGVMKQSGRDRLGINLTFNYNIGTNFFIRNDLAVDNVKAKNSPYNEFYLYANQNPYDRIYDENGKFVEKLSSGDWNPLYNAHLAKKNTSTYTSIQDNFNIDWRIIPALRLQGRISYTRQFDKRDLFKSPESLDYSTETDPKKKGTYFRSNSQSDKFDGNLTLQYNKVLGVHSLNVGVGSNLTESTEEGDSYTGVGFVNPNMIFIGAATSFKENSSPDGSYDKSRLVGFFGNVNYGYDNRYFLDLSFRTDGSSKFGRNSRFAPFWSVGVAWNVHKEAFWSGDEKSSLKLRASVGSTGTTNFSSTQALTTYNYDFSKIYNGVFGVSLAGYGNPELKWQNTISYNVGVDMTLLKGLVTFNGDFYIKNTENLLLPLTVAPSTGFSSYVENIGKLRNTGIEGRLRLNLIRDTQRDLRWNVTLSAFHNKSKITKLSNQLEEINKYANSDWYNQGTVVYRQYEAGRSQTALMMVRSGGIDPATGNEVYIKRNGELTFEYDANDKVKCGDMKPTIEGNVNTNLTWKGFTLYMLFKYQFGAKAYNGTLASKVEGANPYKNADKRVLYDRWKEPGDHAKFRRIDDRTSPYQTTRLVFDNDLFSLSSVSLSYELPREISQKIYADRVRLMLSTTDVFRLSTIKQERGTSYPFARTFNLSLNVTF